MSKLVLALLLWATSSAMALGAPFVVRPGGKVSWTAIGKPGWIKIINEKGKLTGSGTDEGGVMSGEFKVDVASFDTALPLRDEHMRDKYLEIKKYPYSTFKLRPFRYIPGKEASFDGDLTIKADTAPVTGKATVSAGKVIATFVVDMTKYPSIGMPVYMGIKMANEVNVTVEFIY